MSVLAEVSITPMGVGESISKYVAQAVDIVSRSGLDYKFCPMGTVIEGEMDQVLRVIQQCQQRLAQECSRMIINVRIDWRKGGRKIEENIAHVQQHLAGAART